MTHVNTCIGQDLAPESPIAWDVDDSGAMVGTSHITAGLALELFW